jgi:hypothetical protein
MTDMTPRRILDAIHEGLEESALLAALGYDATQGRPGRHLLNNALERQGYGRPIDEQAIDQLSGYSPYPDEWIQAIAGAVTGRPNAALREVVAALKQRTVKAVTVIR